MNPTAGKYPNGSVYYDGTMKLDEWKPIVRFFLSQDGRVIWLQLNTAVLPPLDQIPADVPPATLIVDPSKAPKHIDMVKVGGTERGIYKLEGDTLTICTDKQTGKRPDDFVTQRTLLVVLKRVKGS